MAGLCRPNDPNLIEVDMSKVIVLSVQSYNNSKTALFDGVSKDSWADASTFYFRNDGDFIEFYVPEKFNLWRSGVDGYATISVCSKFKKFYYKATAEESYVDILPQITENLLPVGNTIGGGWELNVPNLKAGYYKLHAGYRLDSEWFLESIEGPGNGEFKRIKEVNVPTTVTREEAGNLILTEAGNIYGFDKTGKKRIKYGGGDVVSPTVDVKTNTDTDYILTIKDVNGEKDTPNLKGVNGTDGANGADGFSPVVTVASNTETEYTLSIQTKTETITTPNLKGSGGSGGASVEFCTADEITTMINTAKGGTV